ncbi:MAG TPA: prepilin-type N-terminal cleavage/methylation domain-containing protein [Planctomycetota bacterium]
MRPLPIQPRGTRAGLTLIEMVIAVALFLLLMSSAILAARGGQGALRSNQGATELETRARRALDRMATELLGAGNLEPIAPGLGSQTVIYSQVRPWNWNKLDANPGPGDGVAGLQPLWGLRNSLSLEMEPGESDDGVDEDGDGLIDEGQVVLTLDLLGTPRRVVLCTGVRELGEGEAANGLDDNGNGIVDEGGFNVLRTGDVLQLRLTLVDGIEGETAVRTLETSVRLRN